MTTFDDDMIRLEGPISGWVPLTKLGLEWPPPAQLVIADHGEWRQVSCSEITDDERAKMTNVFRGALYRPVEEAS